MDVGAAIAMVVVEAAIPNDTAIVDVDVHLVADFHPVLVVAVTVFSVDVFSKACFGTSL